MEANDIIPTDSVTVPVRKIDEEEYQNLLRFRAAAQVSDTLQILDREVDAEA